MTRVLVTGASGFAGSYLVSHLLAQKKYDVYGTVFGDVNSLHGLLPTDHTYAVNLMDPAHVETVVTETRPEWVFHLAALTSPAASFQNPTETLTNNIAAQVVLLEALLRLPQLPRTLIVGSAEEYGAGGGGEPIDEVVEFKPMSPYAVSKIAQDYLGLEYFLTKKLPVVRVRPFNHTGPKQTPHFVVPAFAKQVAEIEAGASEPVMKVGNLTPIRDFTDVTDMVAAYELALISGKPGAVYNIGSGNGVAVQQIVDYLLAAARVPITIAVDPERYRPADVPVLVCNASAFRAQTGWEPRVLLKETVQHVLDYWRAEIAHSK